MKPTDPTTPQPLPVPPVQSKPEFPGCPHRRETVYRHGLTNTLGVVVCNDCGRTREWNVY